MHLRLHARFTFMQNLYIHVDIRVCMCIYIEIYVHMCVYAYVCICLCVWRFNLHLTFLRCNYAVDS